MPTAKEYLEMLYQQDPQLFSEPLKVSILAEPDLQFMEQQIGYRLPKQFEAFLTTYQLPSMTMFITFCGELASLYKTFSREKNGYVLNQSEEFAVVDLSWNGTNGNCGDDYLKCFKRYELSEAWLKAGFIDIGSFYIKNSTDFLIILAPLRKCRNCLEYQAFPAFCVSEDTPHIMAYRSLIWRSKVVKP